MYSNLICNLSKRRVVTIDMKKDFFVESAFGEVYKGTFFDEDVKNLSLMKNNKSEEIVGAAAPVRMQNEVDVARESAQAVQAAYKLGGDFGVNFSNYFSGKIFGGM